MQMHLLLFSFDIVCILNDIALVLVCSSSTTSAAAIVAVVLLFFVGYLLLFYNIFHSDIPVAFYWLICSFFRRISNILHQSVHMCIFLLDSIHFFAARDSDMLHVSRLQQQEYFISGATGSSVCVFVCTRMLPCMYIIDAGCENAKANKRVHSTAVAAAIADAAAAIVVSTSVHSIN